MRFAGISKLTLAGTLVLAPAVGHAQTADRGLAELLRECRILADAGRRMACYDGIVLDDGDPPKQVQSPVADREPRTGTGFGSNQLQQTPTPNPEPERISVRAAQVTERQPGIYLLTLEDGTQWQFIDAAPAAYDPPRAGSNIEIVKASMGSYLIRYAGQRSIRARRVR